jgi:hypothetical protein
MAGLGDRNIDGTLTFYAQTFNTSGDTADATSPPAYRVYEDETDTPILTGTMALRDSSNTDGFYSEQITLSAANGFEEGKSYNIRMTASSGGIAGAAFHAFNVVPDIESRIPAALVGGRMDSNVGAISGSAPAADTLESFMINGVTSGTVNDGSASASSFVTDLTEASDNHYNGSVLLFLDDPLKGQSRKISDYDGTSKTITLAAAFTEAPDNGDAFVILGRIEA